MHFIVGSINQEGQNQIRMAEVNDEGHATDNVTESDEVTVNGTLSVDEYGQVIYTEGVGDGHAGKGDDGKNKDKK